MNHKDFTFELQKMCHVDHQQCATLLSALLKLMVQAAIDQIPVAIYGLGTFSSHKHPEYIQENPTTGEQTLFPPRISYRFQADNDCALTQEDNAVLIKQLSDYSHQSVATTASFLLNFAQSIKSHLAKQEEVEIHGLGQFHIISAHQSELHRMAFTPDEQMREQVNSPFNCFEPVIIREGVEPKIIHDDVVAESVIDETEAKAEVRVENEADSEESVAITASDRIVEEVSSLQSENADDVVVSVATDEATSAEETIADVKEESPEKESLSSVNLAPEEEPTVKVPVTKESTQESSNKLFYALICVTIIACIAFGAYLFFGDNEPVLLEAEVITADTKTVEVDVVPVDDVQECNTTIALVEDTIPTITEESSQDPAHIAAVTQSAQTPQSPQISQPTHTIQTPQTTVQSSQPVSTKNKEEKPKEFHRMMGADGQPVMVTLNPGERLTIVALNQFGDKAFWPYIFDVNSDRLKAPNLVQAGMKLYLPDPAYYGIDANSEESLRKAKNRGAQLLK